MQRKIIFIISHKAPFVSLSTAYIEKVSEKIKGCNKRSQTETMASAHKKTKGGELLRPLSLSFIMIRLPAVSEDAS